MRVYVLFTLLSLSIQGNDSSEVVPLSAVEAFPLNEHPQPHLPLACHTFLAPTLSASAVLGASHRAHFSHHC